MSEEWNDLAQSEKDGPSVLTQIILLTVELRNGHDILLRNVIKTT